MLRKNKLTKKIWYNRRLWDIDQIISPSKNQDFLVLKIKDKYCKHEDGSPRFEFAFIDCHNESFYPNTKLVRQYFKKLNQLEKNVLNFINDCSPIINDANLKLYS